MTRLFKVRGESGYRIRCVFVLSLPDRCMKLSGKQTAKSPFEGCAQGSRNVETGTREVPSRSYQRSLEERAATTAISLSPLAATAQCNDDVPFNNIRVHTRSAATATTTMSEFPTEFSSERRIRANDPPPVLTDADLAKVHLPLNYEVVIEFLKDLYPEKYGAWSRHECYGSSFAQHQRLNSLPKFRSASAADIASVLGECPETSLPSRPPPNATTHYEWDPRFKPSDDCLLQGMVDADPERSYPLPSPVVSDFGSSSADHVRPANPTEPKPGEILYIQPPWSKRAYAVCQRFEAEEFPDSSRYPACGKSQFSEPFLPSAAYFYSEAHSAHIMTQNQVQNATGTSDAGSLRLASWNGYSNHLIEESPRITSEDYSENSYFRKM